MLWEVEVTPRQGQPNGPNPGGIIRTSTPYLLSGELTAAAAELIGIDLLHDHTIEEFRIGPPGTPFPTNIGPVVNILLKPGVMDPAAQSVEDAILDLGLPPTRARTARRLYFDAECSREKAVRLVSEELSNDAVEELIVGPLPESAWRSAGRPYEFKLITVPIRDMGDVELMELSRTGQLSLTLVEMQTVQEHFRKLGRDATDIELETVAQTWSEHCSHKTLKGRIEFTGPDGTRRYENLLKETIFHATTEIRRRLGEDDWCVSVFEDNAGIVKFDDANHICFKVETHNHPSAIEPYGGANTGLGGVIRDVLGTGLGGKPICNTDVFCFARPDFPADELPRGVLHPKRVMRGVVAGVRDYGNRMGIPTINGAVCFDDRYLGNPLVFCGTVGLIPKGKEFKEPQPGDLIVAVGGRTGRDGIHGATFSSIELDHQSEELSGGAVQIGNAITEKKLVDVLLQARDLELFTAITDCGAGGFSSAVGEMGEKIGANVQLEKAPLKYEGLSYTEIWISEAQERMVLAVPPGKWDALHKLCGSEGVEATVIGEFEPTGRLRLSYEGTQVADMKMDFLHDGRPPVVREASWSEDRAQRREGAETLNASAPLREIDFKDSLLRILSSLNVCSKEWIIRQYDHEVQGRTIIKPLVGINQDGPGDAAVILPVPGSPRGITVGCGINPHYGKGDPYHMAASAIDESVRNVVAVGADPSRVALLDNFCWGNTERPETLGSLVRAAEACRDVALALGTPFISGKDSLNNEFHTGSSHIRIPDTLLISALGYIPDTARCVTMDLKAPGNSLYLLGATHDEMGCSHFNLIHGVDGGTQPSVDLELAPRLFKHLFDAISRGLILSCHDLSEGGLAVAAAEMCFAGGIGAELDGSVLPQSLSWATRWFSESNSRFLIEVAPSSENALMELMDSLPIFELGTTKSGPYLKIRDPGLEPLELEIDEMKRCWQSPLTVLDE